VLIDGHVLEKPADQQDARRMLGMIAGRTHTVITALSVIKADHRTHEIHSKTVSTEVTLAPLSMQEINTYVDTCEPLDKAGSYAIQGKGGYMVAGINGSYTNVVGLPLSDLVVMFREKFSLDITRYFYAS
jgi:septum formation protein